MKELLGDPEIRKFLLTNEYQGVIYYNKERFEEVVSWLAAAGAIDADLVASGDAPAEAASKRLKEMAVEFMRASNAAEYKLDQLIKSFTTRRK